MVHIRKEVIFNMVEKIIVSPQSIRGLGNIIMPKSIEDFSQYSCTNTRSDETVNGTTQKVYSISFLESSTSLAANNNIVAVGSTVALTATVTSDGDPVNGASVNFLDGNEIVATSTTNASGIATANVTPSTNGQHTYKAVTMSGNVYGSTSQNVTVYAKYNTTATLSILRVHYPILWLEVNVKDSNDNAVADAMNITLYKNNVAVDTGNLINGWQGFDIEFDDGDAFKVIVDDSDGYYGSTSNTITM